MPPLPISIFRGKRTRFLSLVLEEAIKIRCHIEETVRLAALEADEKKRKQMLTFVVAGGGSPASRWWVNFWIPADPLQNEQDRLRKRSSLILCEGLGTILNMLPEKPMKKAWEYMKRRV